MTPSGTRAGVRRLRVGSVAVLAVAVLVLALAVTVASTPAHLVGSVPAPGTTLAAPPTRVSLTFSTTLDPTRSHLVVGSAAGSLFGCGVAVVSGNTITRPVTIVDPGTYLVAFHVVTGDGSALSAVTSFTVASGRPDAARPGPCADGDASADPSVYGTGGHDHEGVDPLSLIVILLDAALIVVVIGLLVRPRVRQRRAGAADRTAVDAASTGSGQVIRTTLTDTLQEH